MCHGYFQHFNQFNGGLELSRHHLHAGLYADPLPYVAMFMLQGPFAVVHFAAYLSQFAAYLPQFAA